jgi:cytochrome c oxidase subunit III
MNSEQRGARDEGRRTRGEAGSSSPVAPTLSPLARILTPDERDELQVTALVRHRLEEQFHDLEQQHEVASLGMWVFLVTELLFFGTLFLGLSVYRYQYPLEFEQASEKMNWIIGGINTVVLLVSSLTMVLAVHFASVGTRRLLVLFLGLTALLGVCFLVLKGVEYYGDYVDNLIPGWKFDDEEWLRDGLKLDQIPHVKLYLLFYWIMTGLHGLHVLIGIIAVSTMLILARRGVFSSAYYSPVDVTALYWHFVDLVWIFLLPMLYLLGTHKL